jgi:hypothetical protein
MSMTVERTFVLDTGEHGKKIASDQPAKPCPVPAKQGRVPRITRLMALAIKFEGYIRDGVVDDYAELARLGHVTRARMTQIMDLNLLAPDIQEAILDLPRTKSGRDLIALRDLRIVLRQPIWRLQKAEWESFKKEA